MLCAHSHTSNRAANLAFLAGKKQKHSNNKNIFNFARVSKIICDWDDTITDKDTISLCFDTLQSPKHDLAHFLDIYTSKRKDFCVNKLPFTWYAERNTISKEIEFQKNLKEIELSSLYECIRLKVFQGVHISQFAKQVSQVQIKPGFNEFFSNLNENLKFVILSVNWTGQFIKEYFRTNFNENTSHEIKLLVNEFEFDSNGICTGDIDPTHNIRTGYDKLRETQLELGNSEQVWYIGDSSTDVLSMIHCDRAIIMKGGSAKQQLNQMGYKVFDINDDDIQESIESNEQEEVKFLQVNDWYDLVDLYSLSIMT